MSNAIRCPVCGGRGVSKGSTCPLCNGTCEVPVEKFLSQITEKKSNVVPIRREELNDDDFTRQYLDEEAKIFESVCKNCGTVLVGSFAHGLREKESQHSSECPLPEPNGAG